MPKEVLADARGPWSYTTGSNDIESDPSKDVETKVDLALELSWGVDTIVQLASVNRAVEEFGPGRGWCVELDRFGINKLIKVLRRARDQAYGADE